MRLQDYDSAQRGEARVRLRDAADEEKNGGGRKQGRISEEDELTLPALRRLAAPRVADIVDLFLQRLRPLAPSLTYVRLSGTPRIRPRHYLCATLRAR